MTMPATELSPYRAKLKELNAARTRREAVRLRARVAELEAELDKYRNSKTVVPQLDARIAEQFGRLQRFEAAMWEVFESCMEAQSDELREILWDLDEPRARRAIDQFFREGQSPLDS